MSTIATENRAKFTTRPHSGRTWGFRFRGLLGALAMIACGVPALLSPPLAAEGTWGAACADAIGWAIFLAAAAFRFWPTLYIGGKKTYQLIDQGPYSVCRNPLYLGTFLLWLSAAFFFKSVTIGLGAVLGVVFYLLITLPAEEQHLAEVLGEPYLDYCRRVPRLWPNWSLFRTPATVEVTIVGLVMEARRAARWLCLPLVAEIVAQLRTESWWHCLFNLP